MAPESPLAVQGRARCRLVSRAACIATAACVILLNVMSIRPDLALSVPLKTGSRLQKKGSGRDIPSFDMGVVTDPNLQDTRFSLPPKEARMFRVVERNKKSVPNFKIVKKPSYIASHPCPPKEEVLDLAIPGDVQKPSLREDNLRMKLRRREIPTNEEFDKVIQIFALRAADELKYLALQRREFIRRAKGWAAEMLMQELEPSPMTVNVLMKGFVATGDVSGAKFWITWMERSGRYPGRFHYNCVIRCFGLEGRPHEAMDWFERLQEAGHYPDHVSYGGLVEAWERLGNRMAMLSILMEVKKAEADGDIPKPKSESDRGLPYYPLARSYMSVGDAPRALAVLKLLKDMDIPLTVEAYKIRLQTHLKVPRGPRRDVDEIERAFRDLIAQRPEGGKFMLRKMLDEVKKAIGESAFEDILKEFDVKDEDLAAEVLGNEAAKKWRTNMIKACVAFQRSAGKRNIHVNGKGLLRSNEDEGYRFRKRQKELESGGVMGETAAGYRVATGTLPEWLTLKKPIKFGY